jgi:PadR family transcriptional regulator PadR
MKRKSEELISIEAEILEAALELQAEGIQEFYGYIIAKRMRDRKGARRLTAHGTLYKALSRMQRLGWLSSRWEDPAIAGIEERPIRRLYTVTAPGLQILEDYRKNTPAAIRLTFQKDGARA